MNMLSAITTSVSIATMPAGETPSAAYTMRVNGHDVPVHVCRVSAMPFNQVWPGYQRPLDQTELAAFASWDAAGAVTVEVTAQRAFQSAVVRPLARGITPVVDGQRIIFNVPGPGQFTLELDGMHQALHIFANPPEQDVPDANAPNVRYFGPGVHRPGKISLASNETVYIAAGAVVYGFISGRDVAHVRILGRGVLDVSGFERDQAGGAIRLTHCTDVTIDGLILRDPDVWCCALFGCSRATISNLKLVGLWRYNADGIDLCNSEDIVVRDCFVRAFDDCIVLKGLKGDSERPVRNILVERCVIWCDWGRALEIGAETCAPEVCHVVFADCDILRANMIAMDIQHGDRATVHDILFRDIRVEIDDFNQPIRFQNAPGEKYSYNPDEHYCPQLMYIGIHSTMWSADKECGRVHDVAYRNISVTSKPFPGSTFVGLDADHDVKDVTVENLAINGQPITTPAAAHLQIGSHVQNVRFQ